MDADRKYSSRQSRYGAKIFKRNLNFIYFLQNVLNVSFISMIFHIVCSSNPLIKNPLTMHRLRFCNGLDLARINTPLKMQGKIYMISWQDQISYFAVSGHRRTLHTEMDADGLPLVGPGIDYTKVLVVILKNITYLVLTITKNTITMLLIKSGFSIIFTISITDIVADYKINSVL